MTKSEQTPEAQDSVTTSGPDLIAIEHEIAAFWKAKRSFEKLVELCKSRPEFRFVDGPITANNPMGVHHAWGRSLKDIFIRYKCLDGYGSFFQNGFDCQGLWVEVEVEKELGFKGKPDIEKFGIEKFNQACRERVNRFSKVQTEQSIRLGQWMRWDDSYYTHTDGNIEGIWHFLKKCHENGWLYQSGLSMPWCTRCGTSLSEHEMAGSYKELSHLAVFIKLPLPKLDSEILVWTTTPWTLAANTALAVNPALTYLQISVEGHAKPLIVGKDAVKSLHAKVKVIKEIKGSELVGLEYEAVFSELPVQQKFEHKTVAWDDVDAKEGTGVVHIAPGCGREDFELGKRLGLTTLVPIDEQGNYSTGYGWLEGRSAHDVADEVAERLAKSNKLFRKYMHEHSYPVCWRCKHELVFRLVDEWYIACQEIRPKAIAAAAQVEWQPEHVGKRMEDWLRNMGDWCISRKRFWGLPLPFYKCAKCETLTVVGSRQELRELSGDDLARLPELHKPWIDQIAIKCPKCSSAVPRVPEVGDCWLDAGIVPYSTRGYFSDAKARESWQPADWICEMSEQVRLWFYSMLFMGTTLSGKAPYKRVLTYERVLSETGSKFSKTGYMIKFDEAAEKMGVDTMRYYFASQSPVNDLRFGYTRGDEARRQLISLWNVHSFFLTYASIDKPNLSALHDPKRAFTQMDYWLMARLHEFLKEAREGYEGFNTPLVTKAFESFTEDISNWYIRANRRRFWKSGDSADKLAGYWALFQALRGLCVALAPIMPHFCEKIWQDSIRAFDAAAPESVHHSQWPKLESSWANTEILKKSESVQLVINLAHRIRAEAQLKVRQPLATLYLLASERSVAALKEMEAQVKNELNVKAIQYLSDRAALFERFLELDLKKAGPVLKGDLNAVMQAVNALSGAELAAALKQVDAAAEVQVGSWRAPASIFLVRDRARSNLAFAEERGTFVALDTGVTAELEEEGWVRDILRQCQVQRKDSGFEVTDRIVLGLRADSQRLAQVIERYRGLIEQETLAKLELASLQGSKLAGEVELSSGKVAVSMIKQ